MIISRTPYRISFLGGGTDYPEWYLEHGGAVIEIRPAGDGTFTIRVSDDDPLLGEQPKFTHFYLRQLRAEELYESLITATRADKTRGTYQEQEAAKREWMKQFVIAFGTDEGDESTTFNGTIPQVLMMFNGDLMKKATNTSKGSMLWKVANSKMKLAQQINYLFRAALARRPTKAEIDIANKLLIARKGDAAEALKDVWWVVLNSNEFIFVH